MPSINTAAVVLIEFDSMKGPIIRKKNPADFEIPANSGGDDFLMWTIRAKEFSVRKIMSSTAYAKAMSLRDPNFQRKHRQFGLALITSSTIDLEKAEKLLDGIIENCKKRSENKSYFKMLNGLFQIIGSISGLDKLFGPFEEELPKETKVKTKVGNSTKTDVKKLPSSMVEKSTASKVEAELIEANRLIIFNKVKILDKKTKAIIFVGLPEALQKPEEVHGTQLEIETERTLIRVELRGGIPEELQLGLETLSRILGALPSGEIYYDRILVGIEYLDHLLWEKVDVPYFLSFLQYLISMESFTITEFRMEQFEKQIDQMIKTHGAWIRGIQGKKLDGKRLTEFFKQTGIKREAMEFLVDLLFADIISIF